MSAQPLQRALEIIVNGAKREIPTGCTVTALLLDLDMAERRVAVARNHEVVPRSRYDREALADGDCVEILEAVGGG